MKEVENVIGDDCVVERANVIVIFHSWQVVGQMEEELRAAVLDAGQLQCIQA